MKNGLGVADSNGIEIKVGDYLRTEVTGNTEIHGTWAVYEVLMIGLFPVESYCYSEKGKILPTGYTRGFLSDIYDQKRLLWVEPGRKLIRPDEKCVILRPEEVNIILLSNKEFEK